MSETYLSIFSGIGGLEHPDVAPLLFCEQDDACRLILRASHPNVRIESDVVALDAPPRAGLVVGGWPCQDISSAGTLAGIRGERSGLFFEMLRVARNAGAHTLVGENVPNLLTMNDGADFRLVLEALSADGYRFVAWRILNARQFGLPQHRRRLFIVASRARESAEALHARLPPQPSRTSSTDVFAFYWTGGKRSICFSRGYTPALKIGAADNNGRAPVAVLENDRVRKLNSREFLRLQGFESLYDKHSDLSKSTLLRMAGNAVPRPVGHFVLDAICRPLPTDGVRTSFGAITDSGLVDDGLVWAIAHPDHPLATNLSDFLDPDATGGLSSQAAAGLIVRSIRAATGIPLELFDLLRSLAANRDGRLRPSRSNSFEALDAMAGEVAAYRSTLKPIAAFDARIAEEPET